MTVGTGPRRSAVRPPGPELRTVPPATSRRADLLGPAATALAVVMLLLLCWRVRGFVTDDAWISVRYAENLAEGEGLGWNPGGPPVEGYSNPLLVLVEAAAHLAGGSALQAARALGVLSAVACVVLVFVHGRTALGTGAAAVAALLTAASAPVALWAVGGLETMPVALLLTLGAVELARPDGGRPVVAGAALALLPWLRPEGLVVALALVGASELVPLLRRATRGTALRRLTWLAGLPVLSQAALELARWSLYGHWLPNSVLYKSGTGELTLVLDKFLAQSAVVAVLALAGAALVGWRQRLLLLPFLVYAAGSLGTLDSANHYSRFFLPVWPQLALLAGATVVALASDRSRTAAAGVLVLAAAAASLRVLPGDVERLDEWQERYMTCRAGARADVAAWLVERTPPTTTFSVSDAGLLPARAGGRDVLDAFLLNDPLLQETGPLPPAARARIVHERRPDVIVLASREPDRLVPVYATERAIAAEPGMADYRLAHVGSGGRSCGYHLLAYRR